MEGENDTSVFTYRALSLLAQSSPKSPLRVIALIDYDAFYAQCESVRLGISADVPVGVQQWDAIIALNYPARDRGLKRGISVEDAKTQCPDLVLQHVATWREGCATWDYRPEATIQPGTDKACLDPYRLESRKTLELMKRMLPSAPVSIIEKASVDEVYLDLSAQVHSILLERYPELQHQASESPDSFLPRPRTSVINWKGQSVFGLDEEEEKHDGFEWDDVALSIGSEIVHGMRQEILKQLKYTCSAGIARNKVLAKLASGHNKPNHQTVILRRGIPHFLSSHKFTKIRGLGRELGNKVKEKFHVETVPELLSIPLPRLQVAMGSEAGMWIYNVIRGIEHSEVIARTHVQSMLSAKTFVPKINSSEQAAKWLQIFVADIMGRLEEQFLEDRTIRPTTMTLYHHIEGRFGPTRSKQTSIPDTMPITEKTLFSLAQKLLVKIVAEEKSWPCRSLSLRVAGFEDVPTVKNPISSYFRSNDRSSSIDMAQKLSTESTQILHIPENLRGMPGLPQDALISPATKVLETGSTPTKWISANETNTDFYHCPHCKQSINAADVLEHLDWHVAHQLANMDSSQG